MEKNEITANGLATLIASELHEDWRKTRLNADGTYEPRWKKVLDEEFAKSLDVDNLPANFRVFEGTLEIDIANSNFEQLSPDKQEENFEAAKVCVDILFDKENYQTKEEIGEKIHAEWLSRNEWGREDEVLSKPFIELPVEEQNKDIDQYKIALMVFEKLKQKQKAKEEELSM